MSPGRCISVKFYYALNLIKLLDSCTIYDCWIVTINCCNKGMLPLLLIFSEISESFYHNKFSFTCAYCDSKSHITTVY